MGLGNFPTVSLAEARGKARSQRAKVDEGADPVAARRAAQSAAAAERASQQTFASVAAQYIAQHRQSWKNEKHAAQWTSTLRTYSYSTTHGSRTRSTRTLRGVGEREVSLPGLALGLVEPGYQSAKFDLSLFVSDTGDVLEGDPSSADAKSSQLAQPGRAGG